jgi:peptide deformylase
MIKQIRYLGDSVLRTRAETVQDISDPSLQQLIADMRDTMESAGGVGIAAPQIGVSQRVFIVASRPNERYPTAPLMEPIAMVNPVLTWASETTAKDWEGCLSIPGIRALVPRSTHINVSYHDAVTGTETHAEFHDFIARVWLHEFDHLEGIVFLDRVESTKEIVVKV